MISRETRIALVVAFAVALFITYATWPRNNVVTIRTTEQFVEASTSPQMSYETINIEYHQQASNPPDIISTSSRNTETTQGMEEAESNYMYDINENEKELLLALVFAEGNTESIKCQMAIIQVVFNRVSSPDFPDSIHDVIHEEGQFETVSTGAIKLATPNERNAEALENVLLGQRSIGGNVVFFWSINVDVTTPGTWFCKMHQNNLELQIDNTYFYRGN